MLDSLGITLERVRSEVAGRVAPCEEVSLRSPFTPRVKTVLERARREALVLGLDDIATEHILLALVREREGAASRLLADLGADPHRVRDLVIAELGASVNRIGATTPRRRAST